MKKLNTVLLSAIVTSLTLASCSKKDEEPQNVSLTGKWNFSTVSYAGVSGPESMPFTAGWSDPNSQCQDTPDYIEFKSSKDAVYGNNEKTGADGTCNLSEIPMPYTVSGSTVIFTGPTSTKSSEFCKVVKQTETEMQFEMNTQGKTYTFIFTKAQ